MVSFVKADRSHSEWDTGVTKPWSDGQGWVKVGRQASDSSSVLKYYSRAFYFIQTLSTIGAHVSKEVRRGCGVTGNGEMPNVVARN